MQGVFLVATIDAVLIGIALLAVGVPIALPLIVLTFIAAFFPIVGAVTAGVAAVLVALVSGGAVDAVIILVVIVAVQQLEGNVFYPVVVGKRLRLHPVAILLALTAGGVLAGVAGAFLAIPVAAVVSAVLDYMRQHRARASGRARRGSQLADGRRDAQLLPAAGAGVRRLVARHGPVRAARPAGLARGRRRAVRGARGAAARPHARRRAAAPASSPPTCPASVTGLDQSEEMLAVAARAAAGRAARAGDALDPPFGAALRARPRRPLLRAPGPERAAARFLGSAARLAGELVITDSALRDGGERRGHGRSACSTTARATGLQALVHARGADRRARRRRGRVRRRVVRVRALQSLTPEPAVRNERPADALAEAEPLRGSGSPPRARRDHARRSPGRA